MQDTVPSGPNVELVTSALGDNPHSSIMAFNSGLLSRGAQVGPKQYQTTILASSREDPAFLQCA